MMRLFFFSVLFLAGCSWGERPLQFNLVAETVELDWNLASDASSVIVLDNLMEGLTTYSNSLASSTPDALRPVPALASSWTMLDGGRTYRFHIRPNVYWSDGVRLTAQQFVDSWIRLLDPKTKSESAYHLFVIDGAREFNQGKLSDPAKVQVHALSTDILEVKLKSPAPYFLHLVAMSNTFPIRKDLLMLHGKNWAHPEHIVTLGPYRLKNLFPGEEVELVRNKDYWGERPEIKTVLLKMVPEPITALAMYESGELDILPRELPSQFLDEIRRRPDFHSGPKLSVFYLVFNTKRAPFNRVEVRRAVANAVSRADLAQHFGGAVRPLASLIPPGLIGYQNAPFVPEEKKVDLEGRVADLWYSGTDTWNLMMQTLQKEVADGTGLHLRIDRMEWREFNLKLASGARPDLLNIGWGADYPDPHSFLNVFTRGNEANYSGWTNQAYDKLVELAAGTENEQERDRLYKEAQKILLEDEAVVVPLFFASHMALVRERLKGVVLNPLDKWYFRSMRWLD